MCFILNIQFFISQISDASCPRQYYLNVFTVTSNAKGFLYRYYVVYYMTRDIMDADVWDEFIKILIGILFLAPLKAMFTRVMKNGEELSRGFVRYNFPRVYRAWMKKKS